MSRVLLLVLAVVLAGCEPWGPLPGGRLDGPVASAPPADWAVADREEIVQVETRPGDPYSVNLWGAGIANHFYIAAGEGEETRWARHLVADPEVRLRVGGTVYELRAVRVTEQSEIDQVLVALQRKYDFTPTQEQRDSAWLFRLDSR